MDTEAKKKKKKLKMSISYYHIIYVSNLISIGRMPNLKFLEWISYKSCYSKLCKQIMQEVVEVELWKQKCLLRKIPLQSYKRTKKEKKNHDRRNK
jgi:hypothetical protein